MVLVEFDPPSVELSAEVELSRELELESRPVPLRPELDSPLDALAAAELAALLAPPSRVLKPDASGLAEESPSFSPPAAAAESPPSVGALQAGRLAPVFHLSI